MKEVKKCTFCGEGLFAVTKKCKHCGEWMTKKQLDQYNKLIELGWKDIAQALLRAWGEKAGYDLSDVEYEDFSEISKRYTTKDTQFVPITNFSDFCEKMQKEWEHNEQKSEDIDPHF